MWVMISQDGHATGLSVNDLFTAQVFDETRFDRNFVFVDCKLLHDYRSQSHK
jgi:hypothetical protein